MVYGSGDRTNAMNYQHNVCIMDYTDTSQISPQVNQYAEA